MTSRKKPLIENTTGVYIGNFLRELFFLNEQQYVSEPDLVFEMVNTSALQIDTDSFKVKVDFLPSNLGDKKGFIYYFRCSACNRRVRCLYATHEIPTPLCRVCQRLTYVKQVTSDKRIRTLLAKPHLIAGYFRSNRITDNLLAIKAFSIRKQLIEQAENEVEKSDKWKL